MTCADVERILPEMLDGVPDGTYQNAFEMHLKSCRDCADLVSDLREISSKARQLVESDEPGPQVWQQIAAQLRAEGLIREPGLTGPRLVPRPERRGLWSRWGLVPVAAALLVAGSYVISHRATPQLAKQQSSQKPPKQASPTSIPSAVTSAAIESPTVGSPRAAATDSNLKRQARIVEPGPSAEDQQFLSEVSTRAPSMRETYEQQLQAVDAEIRDVQSYLDNNPQDADARQHLMDAYQQKALLYQIALDRIQ